MNSEKYDYQSDHTNNRESRTGAKPVTTMIRQSRLDGNLCPGDTSNRIDAVIIDEKKSIPIEIKSPSEVPYINIKSIRQQEIFKIDYEEKLYLSI